MTQVIQPFNDFYYLAEVLQTTPDTNSKKLLPQKNNCHYSMQKVPQEPTNPQIKEEEVAQKPQKCRAKEFVHYIKHFLDNSDYKYLRNQVPYYYHYVINQAQFKLRDLCSISREYRSNHICSGCQQSFDLWLQLRIRQLETFVRGEVVEGIRIVNGQPKAKRNLVLLTSMRHFRGIFQEEFLPEIQICIQPRLPLTH